VAAGEDDRDGLLAVVLEGMAPSVYARELERWSGISGRQAGHERHAIGVGPLYDAVATGMLAYSRAAFRVTVLGPKSFRLAPRTLIVSTHRRETDVPLICPPLYFGARLWRHRPERMSFAARDDMFLPGFFAGFPPDLSPRARRLLFRVGVSRFLPRVQVHPISSSSVARAGEIARAQPKAPLDEVLSHLAGEFRARAVEAHLPAPEQAGDVVRAEYADLLWRPVTREEAPGLEDFWAGHAARAAAHFRALVDLVRSGGTLVVFPEGRPSPDGEIGPLRRGLSALVRRAKPEWFLPVGIAYDPLGRGRTRAFVSVGPRVEPPADVESATLRLLRRSTPFTCGQWLAHERLAGADLTPARLAEAVEEALDEGRPIDPDLRDPRRRDERFAEARAAEAGPDELTFLAREYASARED
jgi:1-acyl-sn-glycerol-3-phosphate acyltransferase